MPSKKVSPHTVHSFKKGHKKPQSTLLYPKKLTEMDGSHSKDTIPLEPEGYRRSEKNFTVHFGQLFWIQQS